MQQKIITEIRQALQNGADEQKRKASARFYKPGEAAQVYGVKMNEVRKIGKDFLGQIKNYSKQEIFSLCEELWKSQHLEEAVIACTFTESLAPKYEPTDLETFEYWIKNYVNNWADCDTFCNHTIGSFVMMYPVYINRMKEWAGAEPPQDGRYSPLKPSRNALGPWNSPSAARPWIKRAAAVSLIIPARNGMFLDDILEIAKLLLLDKDDLVQKGYGWMLKAASMTEKSAKCAEQTKAKHLKAVFDFVIKHKAVMPRTALRYAIEKMPPELKVEAMKKDF